jgi:hypothetical protein
MHAETHQGRRQDGGGVWDGAVWVRAGEHSEILANQTGGEVEPDIGFLRDHNLQLHRALTRLRRSYPDVWITYPVFYTPIRDFAMCLDHYRFNVLHA